MERLEGGLINDITAQENVVHKEYSNNSLLSMPFEQRLRREKWALNRFGGAIAPRIFEANGKYINMERIDAQPMNEPLKTGEHNVSETLYLAGNRLREIHQPIHGNIIQYQNSFLKKAGKYLEKSSPVYRSVGIEPEEVYDYIYTHSSPAQIKDYGTTVVHRDYWMNNTLYKNGQLKSVIDWELSGIGSPYEDFAIVDLWVTRIHGHADSFWAGYGKTPNQETTNAFLLAKISDFLSNTTPEALEDKEASWFYWDNIRVAKEII